MANILRASFGGRSAYRRGSCREGKAAGLRTHMLVAVGTALFVIAALEVGMSMRDLSRVIQGIAAGIGFIGAGAILKLAEERQIQGLTTAAGIWMTAAVGVAAGLGQVGLALLSAVLAWMILAVFGAIEHRIERRAAKAETMRQTVSIISCSGEAKR
ncbi:MAG: MgtC/SapB family protein [Chromatiales bacterium]